MDRDLEDLLDTAKTAAREAGDLLLERFRGPARGVREKSSAVDLVSDADLAAEERILSILARRSPGVPVLTEERGEVGEADGGMRWTVDPLDGTQNFLRGIPLWCVSIAAYDHEGGAVGVVHDAVHDECYSAARGAGAWCGDRRLPLFEPSQDVAEMTLVGSYRRAVAVDDPRARELSELPALFGNTRELICAALELAWTAAGRVGALYHESKMQVWDKAAGIVLCREAGLTVCELPPVRPGLKPRLLVSPERHQDALLRIVA